MRAFPLGGGVGDVNAELLAKAAQKTIGILARGGREDIAMPGPIWEWTLALATGQGVLIHIPTSDLSACVKLQSR